MLYRLAQRHGNSSDVARLHFAQQHILGAQHARFVELVREHVVPRAFDVARRRRRCERHAVSFRVSRFRSHESPNGGVDALPDGRLWSLWRSRQSPVRERVSSRGVFGKSFVQACEQRVRVVHACVIFFGGDGLSEPVEEQ